MKTLALLVLCIHLSNAAVHSWKAYYTLSTGLSEFPEFIALNLIDDQLMGYFDSKTNRFKSQFKWMTDNLGKEYDDEETKILQATVTVFLVNFGTIMKRFNQTQGVHTWQFMYGCELMDDGTTGGYWQYGYDGEDFLSFDKNTLTNIAANPQAVITKNKWDANRAQSEYRKAYLENTCIEWLMKYVSYGKNSLERKAAPEVSLLQKDSSSPVICHATGFYPSNIMMTWKKNQDDLYEDVDVSSTLPNEDGSFQKSIILLVKPEEWKKNPDVYRCVVQHVGADKEIVFWLNENKTSPRLPASNNIIAIVVGCVVALAVLAVIIGLIVWTKSNGYGRASNGMCDTSVGIKKMEMTGCGCDVCRYGGFIVTA